MSTVLFYSFQQITIAVRPIAPLKERAVRKVLIFFCIIHGIMHSFFFKCYYVKAPSSAASRLRALKKKQTARLPIATVRVWFCVNTISSVISCY